MENKTPSLAMLENSISERMSVMVGEHASNNQYEVQSDYSSLCKAIKYLVTQIKITANLDREDAPEHVEKVLESTINILNPTNYEQH